LIKAPRTAPQAVQEGNSNQTLLPRVTRRLQDGVRFKIRKTSDGLMDLPSLLLSGRQWRFHRI